MNSSVKLVGILNVTPDSYFDGGKFTNVELAVQRAKELIQQGADIIDVGGESTGPGSKDVSVEEELQRVLPVVEALMDHIPNVHISVDTYKAQVAKAVIAKGAYMINDVTAGRGDKDMFSVIADSAVQYVMMFAKDDSARTTVNAVSYKNVVQEITDFLAKRKQSAVLAGIDESRIIVDPGMGHFISSDPQYSFEVLKNIQFIHHAIGCPVYVSPSRKSFLAGSENLPPADRLPATIVASAVAAQNGATYIRTHDVAAVRRGIETMKALT